MLSFWGGGADPRTLYIKMIFVCGNSWEGKGFKGGVVCF